VMGPKRGLLQDLTQVWIPGWVETCHVPSNWEPEQKLNQNLKQAKFGLWWVKPKPVYDQ
jgi:hypothetical protein